MFPRLSHQRGPASGATQSPGLRPTPLSIARVPGEVSHQRVACFFPLVRIPGWVLAGHEEGKEHAHAAALLS